MDSLADMVTFGVPGLIAYKLIEISSSNHEFLKYIGLLIPFFSAFRLAKFNIDTRQTSTFIGLPTPANALFWLSIPLINKFNSESSILLIIDSYEFLILFVILMSLLLVSEIPMFSFKIKSLNFKENKIQFLFILISIALLISYRFLL